MSTTRGFGYHPDDHASAPESLSKAWQSWINAKMTRSEQRMLKLAMGAVGEVLASQRNEIAKLSARVEALERSEPKRLKSIA